ncbi:T-cell activation inhibitor, mitochondrial isoform X5 [Oryctolagus cuniculus]|uniref:T-cell activation inhibitor, mitochondrial isoform X6 n=1 Tax=Oryctolagus cuniculus TaxID=9986 RepID=UPI00222EF05E|nr:T-cell activation inhibitor, mitochondrial isoform X3 [Oryctolagus cuniculus]
MRAPARLRRALGRPPSPGLPATLGPAFPTCGAGIFPAPSGLIPRHLGSASSRFRKPPAEPLRAAAINGCLEVDLHPYSEMFCHLRPLRRLCLEKMFPHSFLYSRALSGAEAVNALRPFYFAVHPDFFGQHPRERPLKEVKRTSDRPIKWDKSYYSFTGFKDPDEDLEQVSRMETTLTSWLDNNGKCAVKKLKNSLPLRKELDRLKDELSHQLQLSDIRWQRSWGIAHRCSQLHSLGRLAQQNSETLRKAKGCTIIFTDRSGMSAVGHVMLGTMDVHHHWTKLFERLPSYFDLQRRLMLLEDQISYLLGGIQVVCIEELQPVLTLEEYYSLLDVFYSRLVKTRVLFHPRSLRGLQMILNSDRYAPSLHELGHFNIPVLCDPANLQWFILTKAQQARENMKRKEELKSIEQELIEASAKRFSLEKLYKEPSISSAQMVDCCTRLLEQSLPSLRGMHLCVSHFYSVLQDGDLCIPWNWKNGEAIK